MWCWRIWEGGGYNRDGQRRIRIPGRRNQDTCKLVEENKQLVPATILERSEDSKRYFGWPIAGKKGKITRTPLSVIGMNNLRIRRVRRPQEE